MKKELQYFKVDNDYGFDQQKFSNLIMKIGGCAAVTACDSFIYFKKYMGLEKLYQGNEKTVSKKDYIAFSNIIKPYLHPRIRGINSLDIYIKGVNGYLSEIGETRLKLVAFSGNENIQNAKDFIISQINDGYPIPSLILRHSNSAMKDFVWHWFLITGYEIIDDVTMVKVVSYGEYKWLNLNTVWNTGHSRKGGLIKFKINNFVRSDDYIAP